MMRKILKISAFLLAALAIFMLMAVLVGKRWAPLKIILIPLKGQPAKVSDRGFTKNADLLTKIDIQKLSEVDWATTFDKALKDKQTVYPPNLQKAENRDLTTLQTSLSDKTAITSKSQVFLKYLAESNLHLDSSQNPFEQAIHYRDNGQIEKISQLIQNIDQNIAQIESITPPEEAIGYHLVRLRLLREIKAGIEEIQFSPKGKALQDIISKDEFAYLEQLSLILKKYLTYFFYPKIRA